MEINRTRINRPEVPGTDTRTGQVQNRTRFTIQRQADMDDTSPAVQDNALAVVAREFQRGDLSRPETLEQILERSFTEILQVEFPETERLTVAQKQELVEWMKQDPILRGKVVGHLERILG